MINRFKFRSWNGEDIISPDYITRDGQAHWTENSIPTSSDILMQSTGLKDKNGKEIYEGDIVKYKYSHIEGHREQIGKIEWRNYGFFNVDSRLSSCMSVIVKAANTYEVIGNIYENPDLLSN